MKILLVDDHILFREGLASLLDNQPGLSVVGSANSMQDAISQTNQLHPELVLMDFDLPDGDGLDYTQQILEQRPEIQVVFLTMHNDDALMVEAINHGAVGHLRKNIPVSQLLDYIDNLKRGEPVFSQSNG